MAVDPRQVLAGFLTITMFLMLANMIKRDHFDSPSSTNQGYSSYCLFIVHLGCTFCIRKYREDRKLNPAFMELRVQNGQLRFRSTLLANGGTVSFCHGEGGGPVREYDETKRTIIVTKTSKSNYGPWLKNSPKDLKPCWTLPASGENRKTEGFVTFSLTNGPEYHVSQIADAVVVARYLGATLVLPDIRGSTPGDKRKFGDVYDVDKFIKNLKGVVKVSKKQQKISPKDIAVVKVPNRVTEDHISEQIDPIYSEKGNIRLATYFPSVNMKKNEKSSGDSVACLAMFGTLELQTEVREVVDSMIERLRTLSRKSDGKFVAVDLRVEMLEKKGCQTTGTKSCYGPEEIALFLKRMGYNKDTTIYLTQSRWDISLDSLKDFFPKTYTKESIMPMDKKEMYLNSETSEFEKVIDFYICTESDSFVPAISGLFYANVAGKRISSGKTQILVPANVPGSASAQNFISPYVSKKNHLAYSCFC